MSTIQAVVGRLLIFRCVHSAVTPGESRFRLHRNGALVTDGD